MPQIEQVKTAPCGHALGLVMFASGEALYLFMPHNFSGWSSNSLMRRALKEMDEPASPNAHVSKSVYKRTLSRPSKTTTFKKRKVKDAVLLFPHGNL